MTREEFEKEVQDIAELLMCFYDVKNKDSRRRLKTEILYYVKNLTKV